MLQLHRNDCGFRPNAIHPLQTLCMCSLTVTDDACITGVVLTAEEEEEAGGKGGTKEDV